MSISLHKLQKLRLFGLQRVVLGYDSRQYPTTPGSGAGKGGGGGGAVREAGGAFGIMEAARENQYFYKYNKKQLEHLREHLDEQVGFHEEAIKRHTKAIEEHTKAMQDTKKHSDIIEKTKDQHK